MEITELNPEFIVPVRDAIRESMNIYESFGSDYSATQLITPPRIIQLYKRHGDQTVIDYKRSGASFVGNGVHAHFEFMLKRSNNPEYLLERYLNDKIAGRRIGGRFDIFHKKEDIYDVKTCKVWKIRFDPQLIHWTEQQNIYAYLLRRMKIDPKNIYVIAIFLDWIESQSLRQSDYPSSQFVQYKLPLWDYQTQDTFVKERIAIHKAEEDTPDAKLPLCSSEDMWEKRSTYKVMKSKNAKRSTKNCEDRVEAEAIIQEKQAADQKKKKPTGEWDEAYIEKYSGERTRCEKFCAVSQWCNTYIKWIYKQSKKTK
jgi:hypothetical protein